MKKIEYIDFARTFSILTIILYHYTLNLSLPLSIKVLTWFGGTGIHLFFFLSGYGLNLGKYDGLMSFYKKRVGKIYLPYAITIVIIFLVDYLFDIYPNEGLTELFSHIFLYKMFSERFINTFGGHFWFISTIIQFYLVFPLILYLRNYISLKRILIICVIVSTSYNLILGYSNNYNRLFTSVFTMYLWEFVLGMYLSQLYKDRHYRFWDGNLMYYVIIFVLGGGLMGLMTFYMGQYGNLLNDFPGFLAYISLSILAYTFLKQKWYKLYSLMLKYSKYTYSAYLIHMLILHIGLVFISIKDPIFIFLGFPTLFLITLIVSIYYEKLLLKIPMINK